MFQGKFYLIECVLGENQMTIALTDKQNFECIKKKSWYLQKRIFFLAWLSMVAYDQSSSWVSTSCRLVVMFYRCHFSTSLFGQFNCLFGSYQSLYHLFIHFLCATNFLQTSKSEQIRSWSLPPRFILGPNQYCSCSLGFFHCCALRSSVYVSSDRDKYELCISWCRCCSYFRWIWLCTLGKTLVSWAGNELGFGWKGIKHRWCHNSATLTEYEACTKISFNKNAFLNKNSFRKPDKV